ncbi:MAG: DNA adenine methylase [Myxococcota bacterium]
MPAPMWTRPTVPIHSRRYLGAKTRLLDFLDSVMRAEVGPFESFADLFAGTGVVAHHFNQPEVRVLAVDLLRLNEVALRTFLGITEVDETRLEGLFQTLEALPIESERYFSAHYGERFFSRADAQRLGAMRDQLQLWRSTDAISESEEALLLTSLLYAADRIAHTCGHYDAYRLGGERLTGVQLARPLIDLEANRGNQVWRGDANVLAAQVDAEVVYLDPPYNSRQYSDTYHLLENLICWEKPPVFGKAGKMNRKHLKSRYCSMVQAPRALHELVSSLHCRVIAFSYNNMAGKGHVRSNACLPDHTLREILATRGQVEVFEQPFQPFNAGKRQIEAHTERLFICRVNRRPQ